MKRRSRLAAATVAVLAAVLWGASCSIERIANWTTGAPLPEVSRRAAELHGSSFVADLHADSLLWGRDLSRRSTVGHVDLPRLRAGGFGLQVFTVVTRFPMTASIERTDPRSPDVITLLALVHGWPWRTLGSLEERVLHQAAALDRLARADGRLVRIRARADLDRLVAEHETDPARIGALLGIEGAHALDRPGALDEVFAAGVRLIGLAHFFDNDFAGSAHGVEKGGLTDRGRALVAEMERRGIAVDLAHSSESTIRDVLGIATKPPLVSHTGVKGTCDNPRNLSDDQLTAIAAKGGVIGIGFWNTAVCGDTVADVARAARYAVDLVGADHVALGSDFDGAVATPFDAAHVASLTQALLDAGLAEDSVRAMLGANAVRVLREVLA
ncbi:MAG: dipeptidase [Candidatus Binatia bacterium]